MKIEFNLNLTLAHRSHCSFPGEERGLKRVLVLLQRFGKVIEIRKCSSIVLCVSICKKKKKWNEMKLMYLPLHVKFVYETFWMCRINLFLFFLPLSMVLVYRIPLALLMMNVDPLNSRTTTARIQWMYCIVWLQSSIIIMPNNRSWNVINWMNGAPWNVKAKTFSPR